MTLSQIQKDSADAARAGWRAPPKPVSLEEMAAGRGAPPGFPKPDLWELLRKRPY